MSLPNPHIVWVRKRTMLQSPQLADLLARYATIAGGDRKQLSEDERRSIRFYETELALRQRPNDLPGRDRITAWVRNVVALDDFVIEYGRLPRVNRRRPAAEIDPETRRLEQWLNHETRPATVAVRCTYQLERLAIVPGFNTQRFNERWLGRYDRYERFLATHRGPPVLRSADARERDLANWAAKQRQRYHAGSLSADRIAALNNLRIWGWGTRRHK